MPGPGQPPYYKNPEEMQAIIDQFFKSCEGHPYINDDGEPVFDKNGNPIIVGIKPPTVTGLCLALGFTSRQALINYENKDQYFDTITRAKLRCHEYAESRLYDKDGANGAKFSLSNNFGWIERSEVNTNISGDLLLESADERKSRIAELLAARQSIIEGVKAEYQVLPEPAEDTETE
jgi:hypothetical protein